MLVRSAAAPMGAPLWRSATRRFFGGNGGGSNDRANAAAAATIAAALVSAGVTAWHVSVIKGQLVRTEPIRKDSREKAVENFANQMQREYNTDVRKVYDPFDTADALTASLRAELTCPLFSAGVLVVAAPRGAGKTTRALQVCRDLVDEKAIVGAVLVDFAEDHQDAREHFLRKFGIASTPALDIYDLMPRSAAGPSARVVIILDNVDMVEEGKRAAMQTLCRELMMASARTGHTTFSVIATCKDHEVAQMLLSLNGGRKVRALAYGKTLVDGDPAADPGTWAQRGLKWRMDDCERLVSAFEKKVLSTKLHRLPDAARTKLLDLAVVRARIHASCWRCR